MKASSIISFVIQVKTRFSEYYYYSLKIFGYHIDQDGVSCIINHRSHRHDQINF